VIYAPTKSVKNNSPYEAFIAIGKINSNTINTSHSAKQKYPLTRGVTYPTLSKKILFANLQTGLRKKDLENGIVKIERDVYRQIKKEMTSGSAHKNADSTPG
jgi:hypothetical protein